MSTEAESIITGATISEAVASGEAAEVASPKE